MHVLFAAAEMAPLMKTGGLADVAAALPPALRALGHDVRVVMPRYRLLRERQVPVEGPIAATFLPLGDRMEELRIWRLAGATVPTYLLDIPAAFERAAIYGERDDDRRFILFARGIVALLQHLREVEGWSAEVLHGHDWHTALAVNYLRTALAYTFGHVGTVFTIHNLAYQGQFPPDRVGLAGLGEWGLIEQGVGAGIAGTFDCMARGIAYADVVTTVSPTYAGEILSAEYGERLDGLLRHRRERLVGILNGIDATAFDPATDRHLAAPYTADAPEGKAACKAALQRELHLAVAPERPLLGVVSRLVAQKGVDLFDQVIPWLLRETDAQLVVLGSGEAHLEDMLRWHAARAPEQFALRLGFDHALAQRIYGGSDAFLMPSRFEPCGLGQMIALRYGSVPIVRATGGLADTVREGWEGNGFRFHPYEAGEFAGAIARALHAFRQPENWAILRARGMREDNSWAHAAERYAGVYEWSRQLARR